MRVVKCPECGCRVEVEPDMEGRRVACPECDERFVVPRRSRRDDEGDDDTPRPRKKRRKAAGPNWGLIGGVTAGALVLVVGGVVAYKATRPKPAAVADAGQKAPDGDPQAGLPVLPFAAPPAEPELPPPPPVPPGWVRFTDPDTGVSADMPRDPGEPSEGTAELLRTRVTDRVYSHTVPVNGGDYRLTVMIFPPDAVIQPDERLAVLRITRHQVERNGRGRFVAERATTLAGVPATEQAFVLPDNATHAARFAFVRSRGKELFVQASAGGPKVTAADRQAFLNSIHLARR